MTVLIINNDDHGIKDINNNSNFERALGECGHVKIFNNNNNLENSKTLVQG